MKNANDYQVTRPTFPAQGIGMPYLTLDEAAQYATEQKGFRVEPSVLLRSGVLGALPICAAFGAGRMHNVITQQEEDLTPCLLIIPPKHLLELETEGTATIHLAHSLDGGMYFPEKQRTREHLRVMVAHLDKLLEMLTDTTQETNALAAPEKVGDGDTATEEEANDDTAATDSKKAKEPRPVNADVVMAAFPTITWGDKLSKVSANKYQWLYSSVEYAGSPRPGCAKLFSLAAVAVALVSEKKLSLDAAGKIIERHPEWLPEWKEKSYWLHKS